MFTKVEESVEFEDPYYGEDDDTLSLCDLPIYGDEAAVDEYLEKYDSSSSSLSSPSSSCDEEFFEFSSSPLEDVKPETIVFCGKLIHYNKKGPLLCPRKAQAYDGVKAPLEKSSRSVRKVSGAKSSSGPGWNLLLFGLAKFPGQVEMRDIKKRQSKSSHRSSYGSMKYGGVEGEIVTGDNRVKGKGLWALLRAIGCMGQSANSMIKASLHCVPKI